MQSGSRASKPGQARFIEEKYFLRAIDDGGTFSKDFQRLYGHPDTLTGQTQEKAYVRQLAMFVSGQAWQPTTGSELVSYLLQKYADEWLATGIDTNGKERPFLRRLTNAPSAWLAVAKYEHAHHAARIDWDNGLKRHRKRFIERLAIYPKSRSSVDGSEATHRVVPAQNPYAGMLTKQVGKGQPTSGRSGVVDRMLRELAARRARRPSEYGPSSMPKNVRAAAQIRAGCIFHGLMEAPWRYRLGKCKRCFEYFVLSVNPSKKPYVRGMHCRDCKNTASELASRRKYQQLLRDLAVDVWGCWPRTLATEERKDWVAKQVTKALGAPKRIRRNWVTRHEKEIVAELQRRARAKKG